MSGAVAGQGRLIAVVGASGVGKDSVIAGLVAGEPGLVWLRRTITRAAVPGGEDHVPVTAAAFAVQAARGDFALHWEAHGLSYGIPAVALAGLAQGRDIVVNLSRGVLCQAAALAPHLIVLHLVASPEVLAARLAGRGREADAAIGARLRRAEKPLDAGLPPDVVVRRILNDGPLGEAVAAARAVLYPVRA